MSSSEKLFHPSGDALEPPGDTLDDRVRRLEQLIDSFDSVRSPEAADSGPAGRAAPAAIQRLAIVSARLRALAGEIEPRVQAGEWDGADTLTARLLLDELNGALRNCRLIASETGDRLERVQSAIREARHLLEQEKTRESNRSPG